MILQFSYKFSLLIVIPVGLRTKRNLSLGMIAFIIFLEWIGTPVFPKIKWKMWYELYLNVNHAM